MLKFGKKKKAEGTDVAVAEGGGEGGDGEGEAAPAKKKLPLLFIIIPVALLVLGGGGAGAFFMLSPKPAAAEGGDGHEAPKDDGHGEKKKADKGGGHGGGGEEPDPALGKITEGPDGVTFYTLPDMVVNIQTSDGRPAYLKLRLTLELEDAHLADQLMAEMPRLQDMFQGFLRELRTEDLNGSAGNFQLRAEILRRVNLILAPGKAEAVLIEEMLVN
ncbi:MAG: flagellar basal body-associated FliL family protein [Alphaproteobacteria bacterium]|nr:flagellar basal body-associated FliL family protein [Alphaproteobacteria bacterium]